MSYKSQTAHTAAQRKPPKTLDKRRNTLPQVEPSRLPSKMICAPYNGTRRKLILAFDIGTTFSGISYRYQSRWQTIILLMLHVLAFSILVKCRK